jgi:hypothetical protein
MCHCTRISCPAQADDQGVQGRAFAAKTAFVDDAQVEIGAVAIPSEEDVRIWAEKAAEGGDRDREQAGLVSLGMRPKGLDD